MQLSDHFDGQRPAPVQDLGHASSATEVWFQISPRQSTAEQGSVRADRCQSSAKSVTMPVNSFQADVGGYILKRSRGTATPGTIDVGRASNRCNRCPRASPVTNRNCGVDENHEDGCDLRRARWSADRNEVQHSG